VTKGVALDHKNLPEGQTEVMENSFRMAGIGVSYWQSSGGMCRAGGAVPIWVDPFIIMMSVPGALYRNHLDADCQAAPRQTSSR